MKTKTENIENQITKYIYQLNPKQKKAILNVVKAFAEEQKDWWDDLSNQQRAAIKEAEDELDAGFGVPHEEVIKNYSKWL